MYPEWQGVGGGAGPGFQQESQEALRFVAAFRNESPCDS